MSDPLTYRAAASVLLLRDSATGPEVLMVKRPGSVSFPNAWVFPGGCMEPEDHDAGWADCCHGLDDEMASQQLCMTSGGRAWWIAAIRELYEETGVLLASSGIDQPATFAELARQHKTLFDLSSIHYLSYWIAPAWVKPRYATRFFVAALPPGQTAAPDMEETLEVLWLKPSEAVSRAADAQDSWTSPRPTVENLKLLDRMCENDVAGLLAKAAGVDKPSIPAIWPESVEDLPVADAGDGSKVADNKICLRELDQRVSALGIELVDAGLNKLCDDV